MSADDFIEIIPHTRLGEATRLWADWLRSRGLQESDFRDHELRMTYFSDMAQSGGVGDQPAN